MMYTKSFKNILFIFFLFTFCFFTNNFLHAEAHISTQAHDDSVTQIAALCNSSTSDEAFFSAGEDGFLIKWTPDNLGEHYQISELQIRLISRSPNGNDVAVYETDGISINRVSVWDWQTFTRKYAKRFSDSVTSLSYSEKGTYLIVGTSAINGVYFLNASTGSIAKKPSGTPSLVSYISTGKSEKSAFMYSPNGSIVYYDIQNGKQKAKFSTLSYLEQVTIFGSGDTSNCFLAGIKNNTLYIIYALTGKTIAQYPARNSLVFTSHSPNETGIYFTTFDGKEYKLNMIENNTLKNLYESASDSTSAPAPLIIKNFIGPKGDDYFTSSAKNKDTILLGSKLGNIYSLNAVPETEKITLFPITEKMYEKIYDVCSDGKDFYFLTRNSIYKSSYDTGVVDRVGSNPSQKNIIKYKDGAVLWTKDSRSSVQYLQLSSGGTNEATPLFSPENSLQNVRLFNDKIVYIQGNSSVGIYDINTKQNENVYTGTSLQDAVLYNENDLYVSKTSAVEPKTALVQVNVSTKETVALRITGEIAYSLSYDSSQQDSPIYGITVTNQEDKTYTKVFSYLPSQKTLINLLQFSDEDPNAFTALYYPNLYTNIGKSNVRSYNITTRKNFQYKRSASMPVKFVSAGERAAILNRDGSISWYNSDSPSVLADWYLTVDGQWFEF